jgi:selenocysteine lyase/cysteine desulfurase
MVEHAGDFNRTDWEPAGTAQRFECGSPNMLGAHILNASLGLLLEHGLESVSRDIGRNVSYLIENTEIMQEIHILSPVSTERRSAIFTFTANSIPPSLLYPQLLAHNIICAQRGGGIRLSPHFYNTESQLEQTIDTLKGLLTHRG